VGDLRFDLDKQGGGGPFSQKAFRSPNGIPDCGCCLYIVRLRKAQGPQTGYGTKKTEAFPWKKKRQHHHILCSVLKRESVEYVIYSPIVSEEHKKAEPVTPQGLWEMIRVF